MGYVIDTYGRIDVEQGRQASAEVSGDEPVSLSPGAAAASTITELRWGVLGTADIASTMVPAIGRCPGASVAAVASRSTEKAAAWARQHGIPRVFGSYEALLASGEVDVVYVPLPNSLHAEWTIRALEAGVPVLCEKPLAESAAGVERIAAVAARTGLPVMEGFMYRFLPIWETVRELISRDHIGPLSTIDATFTFLLEDRASIVASTELGGGALLDVGCYAVHAARWLTGAEPRRVSAFARYGGVDETMVGILDFAGGVLGRFETSIANAERHRVTIAGTRGTIVVREPWLPVSEAPEVLVRRHGAPDERHAAGLADPYVREVAHFCELVRGRTGPLFPVSDALANARALDALAASARHRRVVEMGT